MTAPAEPEEESTGSAVVADIGATNARFARVRRDGRIVDQRVYLCEDHPTLEEALDHYCSELGVKLRQAALAVASPVTGDRVTLTNNPWSFSIAEVRGRFGLDHLAVVNDFLANALSIPRLDPSDWCQIGGGTPVPGAPVGIIGPGSGLGVSGLVPMSSGGNDAGTVWLPLAGEGGHATMAPSTARESAVLERMRRRYEHVSAERALSGPGLVNLYTTLAEIDGVPAKPFTPAQITDPAIGAEAPLCREAVEMFCAMLGTVAGNLALTLGARGGIYIAGGIVPKLGAAFDSSPFRRRFEAKGRLQPYLAEIPTRVITHPVPAFVGLAGLLRRA
jgi:glucokinase